MRQHAIAGSLLLVVVALVFAAGPRAAAPSPPLAFDNTPLTLPDGTSEPAISVDNAGHMALSGLSWLDFGTNLWTGAFGATPSFRGVIDEALQQPGRRVFGGGDADIDIGSTGTLHASTLIFLVNRTFTAFQLGVSAISCPGPVTSTLSLGGCTSQIIDKAGTDRQWITSDGSRVYISYHDSANSSLIRVQRSDDDGFTWRKVGNPVVAQGSVTGDSTFNNIQGPIVADPLTHNVYDIYCAGEAGIQKATSAEFNNVYVSKSTDGGKSWSATLVFHAPLFTSLGEVFPALGVDPVNGDLHAAWSDGHSISYAKSTDQGATWSAAVVLNSGAATTALMPWVAAYDGVVDVVYYATTASSKDSPSAVWNVYLAQAVDGGAFSQSLVSNTSNHTGPVCTEGTACQAGTRNLLDLFEVAIDPGTLRTAVIYTDDTLTTTSTGDPLPQVVLAQQK